MARATTIAGRHEKLLQSRRLSGSVINFSRKSCFDVRQDRLITGVRRARAFALLLIGEGLADVLLFRLRRCVKFGLDTIPIIVAQIRPSTLNFRRELTAIKPRVWKNAIWWLMVLVDVSGRMLANFSVGRFDGSSFNAPNLIHPSIGTSRIALETLGRIAAVWHASLPCLQAVIRQDSLIN